MTIREVTRPADLAVAGTYRLLRRVFEPDELVSIAEWRDTLVEREVAVWTDTAWHLLVAERGGRVLGTMSGTYLATLNVGVTGYLAVDPGARGLGLGTRLRRRLRRLFEGDAQRVTGRPLGALAGEVRRDNPWLRTLVRREAVVALDFPYLQPQFHAGDDPVEFVFYRETFDGPRKSVGAGELRQLLYAIWRLVYRIPRPMSSEPFRRMVRYLAHRRAVPEIEVADLPPARPAR